jgi:hypothetical protein
MGFLSSFKSEFRTFERTPITHGVDIIGERTRNEYTPVYITGVLLKNGTDQQQTT